MLWKTVAGFAFAATLLAQGPADEAAVRQVVQKYVDARDNQDARAVESLFTSDADQLVSTGEWRQGRSALVRGAMASSRASSGKRTITVTSVRFLAPGVALADGRYEISASGTTPARKMWACLILTRDSSGWHITAIRNMLPSGR